MILFSLFIIILYIMLIVYLIIGFDKVTLFQTAKTKSHFNFSIIIPFRNEENHLENLCKSLEQLAYPTSNFEVIFIDDYSTDNSVKVLQPFLDKNKHFKLITNTLSDTSPKKEAIQNAIQTAKYQWIITTDADCLVPKKWLQTFNSFIQNKEGIKFIAAPVKYTNGTNFLSHFQYLDFLSLIGSTIGTFGIQKPIMCNGANLCYHKPTFLNLNGFSGNDNIASGDDVFLMEKFISTDKNSVAYLKSKDAIVTTFPVGSFSELFQQRIRWSSKTTATKNNFTKLVGVLVLLANLLLIINLFIFPIFSLLLFLLKLIVDYILFKKTNNFLNNKYVLKRILPISIFYPFFSSIIFFLSIFTKYNWKGRSFTK